MLQTIIVVGREVASNVIHDRADEMRPIAVLEACGNRYSMATSEKANAVTAVVG